MFWLSKSSDPLAIKYVTQHLGIEIYNGQLAANRNLWHGDINLLRIKIFGTEISQRHLKGMLVQIERTERLSAVNIVLTVHLDALMN
jgi:hypothetical protein